MSYIGQGLPADTFQGFTTDKFSGDGTANKAFTLTKEPFSEDTILVTIDGVVQEPTDDFTVSGTTLTLVGTASNGSEVNVTHMGGPLPIGGASELDLNGASDKLVLDTDGDTTISADTDDQIDVKIGGTDALRVTGTALTGNAVATIGATGTASTLAGIPFYNGDGNNSSIYTHDVSGTDSTAQYNTAYGLTAMDAITTGDNNVALGWGAGTALTTGSNNVAIGVTALQVEDTGTQSIAIGTSALSSQNFDSDCNNVCIGHEAGESITTGRWNHFIGTQAGDDFDTEHSNMGIGYRALGGSVAGGEYNVAIGNSSLDALTSADNVIGIGYYAGSSVTTASDSIFIGSNAGYATTTSTQNTFIGSNAGYGSTGNGNTTVGSYSMYEAGASDKNSCLGQYAGYNITSGDNNLLLGYNAGRSTAPSGTINTGSNNVCLGDNSIVALYCATSTISTSDKRDKTDIENFNLGLEWIEKLQPVTYRWDRRTWYGTEEEPFGTPDGSKKWKNLELGFLAQDVLEVEKSFGYAEKRDDMLTVNLTEDGMYYGMKYERLVTVLVNAVKELSAKVKALEEA